MFDLKEDLIQAQRVGLSRVIDKQHQIIIELEEHYYVLSVLYLVERLSELSEQLKEKNPNIAYLRVSSRYSTQTTQTTLSACYLNDKGKMIYDLIIDDKRMYIELPRPKGQRFLFRWKQPSSSWKQLSLKI